MQPTYRDILINTISSAYLGTSHGSQYLDALNLQIQTNFVEYATECISILSDSLEDTNLREYTPYILVNLGTALRSRDGLWAAKASLWATIDAQIRARAENVILQLLQRPFSAVVQNAAIALASALFVINTHSNVTWEEFLSLINLNNIAADATFVETASHILTVVAGDMPESLWVAPAAPVTTFISSLFALADVCLLDGNRGTNITDNIVHALVDAAAFLPAAPPAAPLATLSTWTLAALDAPVFFTFNPDTAALVVNVATLVLRRCFVGLPASALSSYVDRMVTLTTNLTEQIVAEAHTAGNRVPVAVYGVYAPFTAVCRYWTELTDYVPARDSAEIVQSVVERVLPTLLKVIVFPAVDWNSEASVETPTTATERAVCTIAHTMPPSIDPLTDFFATCYANIEHWDGMFATCRAFSVLGSIAPSPETEAALSGYFNAQAVEFLSSQFMALAEPLTNHAGTEVVEQAEILCDAACHALSSMLGNHGSSMFKVLTNDQITELITYLTNGLTFYTQNGSNVVTQTYHALTQTLTALTGHPIFVTTSHRVIKTVLPLLLSATADPKTVTAIAYVVDRTLATIPANVLVSDFADLISDLPERVSQLLSRYVEAGEGERNAMSMSIGELIGICITILTQFGQPGVEQHIFDAGSGFATQLYSMIVPHCCQPWFTEASFASEALSAFEIIGYLCTPFTPEQVRAIAETYLALDPTNKLFAHALSFAALAVDMLFEDEAVTSVLTLCHNTIAAPGGRANEAVPLACAVAILVFYRDAMNAVTSRKLSAAGDFGRTILDDVDVVIHAAYRKYSGLESNDHHASQVITHATEIIVLFMKHNIAGASDFMVKLLPIILCIKPETNHLLFVGHGINMLLRTNRNVPAELLPRLQAYRAAAVECQMNQLVQTFDDAVRRLNSYNAMYR